MPCITGSIRSTGACSISLWKSTPPPPRITTSSASCSPGLPGPRDFLAGDCTEQTLEAAKDNLASHFTLAGLTERFDETLALLKVLFGWKLNQYASFNITPIRPRKEAVPEVTKRVIAERNRFDVALYEHAVPLFESTLDAHREAVAAALQHVSRARRLGPVRTAFYQAASSLRKSVIRLHSAF